MVKIVTDSCADLPKEIAEELGITVVPLTVRFGQEVFLDGLELKIDEFYHRMTSGAELPKTTQPSPADFVRVYTELSNQTDGIVSIHISAKLSGTYSSAIMAAKEVAGKVKVVVIDTMMASMGIGLLAIVAARAAMAGASLEEVVQLVTEKMSRTSYFGFVSNLGYLYKGGRLGKGQAFLGSILNVKPILQMADGEVYPLERARGYQKAFSRLIEITKSRGSLEELAVLHATTPDEAARLTAELKPLVDEDHFYLSRIGPTIGTYLGPGTLTIASISRS
jgi:DegV family protein with EDD domain